ncbi:uncharacterized protein ARMOST_17741 [Armillaria ostoyae]|uniref:Uncharacterized protein n=1 Tax=Armillaria ostoyae TaxID=47428 RepID=A0A284RZU7_ARMOS|nr:uncharacterized protein ARMOST_17741 [Armillaria ostoyae]
MSNPADIAKLIVQANETIQATDTLWQHKDGVAQAELVEQHPTAIIGNPKAEDVVFHIKQVFKHIQSAHSTTPTFKDYHTVCSFTGTIHSKCDKAIIEDSSNEEASIVAATEEDTVMGNPDAPSAPLETDSVLIPSATIHCKADTVILCFEQMNIDEDIDVIVNRDPAAGNIVEGHKVPLPKFLKNKKAAQAAKAAIAKGKAIKAANQARKCPHTSTDHAFKDSPYTIAVADLAINNEASQSIIDAMASLVIAGDHINPFKSYLCFQFSELAESKVPHRFAPVSSASQPNSEGGCAVISAFWYLQLMGIMQFLQ